MTLSLSLFLLPVLFAVLSCEQPFRAGLGAVVDVRAPTVTLESPSSGAYIWGTQVFTGFAEDDYIIEKVEFRVTNQPGFTYYYDNDRRNLKPEEWVDFTRLEIGRLSKTVQNKATWEFEINTRKFPDGDIKIEVRATDSQNKVAKTDEIVFMIKNTPPAITVTAPFIAEKQDGDPGSPYEPSTQGDWGTLGGGAHLNYNMGGGEFPLAAGSFSRKLDIGSVISGTISYDEDIYTDSRVWTEVIGEGDEAEEREWYPPQIRMWPVGDEPGSYPAGEWPPHEGATDWQTLAYTGNMETDNLFALGIGNYQFAWTLPKEFEAGRFYGFEIRALSKDGRSKFQFPRDYWTITNPEDWDEIPRTPDQVLINFLKENRYVLFYLKEQSAFPTVELYGMENLSTWDGSGYTDYPYTDDEPHPLVNQLIVSKNGAFTLRYKASHPDSIGSAEVYWEKDDRTMRGRFIWDAAADVPTNTPYSQWGAEAPSSRDPTRNFIFTYNDKEDRLPADPAYHSLVRGKSKVQRFLDIEDWNNRQEGIWSTRTTDDNNWADMLTLDEGVYNIEIYARSPTFTGVVNYKPFTNTIRLDWGPPTVRVTDIKGAAKLDLPNNTATVNGVIETWLNFDDSRIADSGLRMAKAAYKEQYETSSLGYSREQRWLLITAAGENQMDNVIAAHNATAGKSVYWPDMPDETTRGITITGASGQVTVARHGVVSESKFRLRTSAIYPTTPTPNTADDNALADGTYYLYVFARDNAFNTGYDKKQIIVNKASDEPTIDFIGEIQGTVTDPNISAQTTATGFKPTVNGQAGPWLNKLGSGSNIRMQLRDDDSLDLGTATEASQVRITLSPATIAGADGNGIVALAESVTTALIELDNDEIKAIFAPQSVGTNGERNPTVTREGTILQSVLLEKLKAKATTVTQINALFNPRGVAWYDKGNLPDGIYRMQVFIKDYGRAKLRMENGTTQWGKDPELGTDPDEALPESVESTTTFWIHVESTNPDIAITTSLGAGGNAVSGGWLNPTNGTDAGDGVKIRGTMSDRNGPVTVRVIDIVDQTTGRRDPEWGTGSGALVSVPPVIANMTSSSYNSTDGNWNAGYEAQVRIDKKVSANITVTLEAMDRFGSVRTTDVTYKLDLTPPEVSLQREMDNFDREGSTRSPSPGTSTENQKRFANGVVYFVLSATDNLQVEEVQWWLLNTTTAPTVPTAANTTVPNDWHAPSYNGQPTNGKWGRKTSAFSARTYIDTTTLTDNSNYYLYAIAKDTAGLYSTITAPLQTIYVRQLEDAPYFESSASTSSTAIDKQQLTISLNISDDDGFLVNNASGVAVIPDDALTIYLKQNTAVGAVPTPTDVVNGEWGSGIATTYTALPLQRKAGNWPPYITVSTMGGKNFTLTLKLNEVPSSGTGVTAAETAFAALLVADGLKHYVIEAKDSWQGKFKLLTSIPTGEDSPGVAVTASDDTSSPNVYRKTWRQYYSFMLDSNPPKIELTAPAPAAGQTLTYGGTASMNVVGTLSDTYLKKTTDNNYYFKARLDGKVIKFSGGIEEFKLGTAVGNGSIPSGGITTTAGVTTVAFSISDFITQLNTSDTPWGPISNGYHTLTLIAEDESGQTGSAQINFIKDQAAPTFAFVSGFNDNKTVMQSAFNTPTATGWWNATTAPNHYTQKRNASAASMPVISYDTVVPSITGTFSDVDSNININSFQVWIDGNTTPLWALGSQPTGSITAAAKNVTWTVYLTKDGSNVNAGTSSNPILVDGAHSIELSIADAVGNTMARTPLYGFRIISTTPSAKITGIKLRNGANFPSAFTSAFTGTAPNITQNPDIHNVFGDRATGTNNPETNAVFVIQGEATGYNVADVELIVRYTDTLAGNTPKTRRISVNDAASGTTDQINANQVSAPWSFVVTSNVANAPPGGTGREAVMETYKWEVNVPRSYVLAAGKGSGTDLTQMRAGNYEISAVAIDRSTPNAKRSEEAVDSVWRFVVDRTSPAFTFNLLYDANQTAPAAGTNVSYSPTSYITSGTGWANNAANRNVIQDAAAPFIKGSVSDELNDLKDVQIQISRWNYSTSAGAWQMWNGGTPTNTGSWVAWSNSEADTYWRAIPAPEPPDPNPKARAVNFPMTDFADGYYRVRLRARDVSVAPSGTTSTAWTGGDGNPAYSVYAFFFLDRTVPVITADTSAGYISSRYLSSNNVPFTVQVSDNNHINNIVVSVEAVNTGATVLPANQTFNVSTLRWGTTTTHNQDMNIAFNPTNLPDGSYKINFKVTDLAGREATGSRTVRLDNTPPTATVKEPRAGVMQVGGEPFSIEGSTDDTGINGSASGPAGIWYRIGYGNQTALPTLTSTMTAAQRSAAIMAWAATTDSGLVGVPTTGNRDTGSTYNTNFDTASRAATAGSLWYKYTGTTSTYDRPQGFGRYIDSSHANDNYNVGNLPDNVTANLYTWLLNADRTVVTNYSTGSVTLKGRSYTNGRDSTDNARYLARPFATTPAGTPSTHSLPLVVRVVDTAGNVFYELHELWLHPNGDNPNSVVNNPAERFTAQTAPRGGQIQINGVAKDNVSIRKVIYRIRVDATNRSAAGNAPTGTGTYTINNGVVTGSGPFVRIPGAPRWEDDGDYDKMRAVWNSYASVTETVVSGTAGTLSQTGWHVATLEAPYSSTSAWNFMLNASGEITALIKSMGFPTNNRQYVHVWVDVLAFDGKESDQNSAYNLMSLGDGNTDATRPRPYVREFYFTTSAPEVTAHEITVPGSTTSFTNYATQQADQNIRGGQFAVRAALNGNGRDISQIQVRLPNETAGSADTSWVPAYVSGSTTTLPTGVTLTNSVGGAAFAGGTQAVLTFQFDSKATSAVTGFRQVRSGAWATSGGKYTIEVIVKDNQTPTPAEASYTFEVGIDNFTPFADRSIKVTASKVAGSNVLFMGRVFDYTGSPTTDPLTPPYNGIKDVSVWFTEYNTGAANSYNNYISMTSGQRVAKGNITATAAKTALVDRNYTFDANTYDSTGNSINSISTTGATAGTSTTFTLPTSAEYVKVLSQSGGAGITWQGSTGSGNNWADIAWILEQNTIGWTDGYMTMHYIVTDNAGNSSYYRQHMIVMNNTPQITKITLYTDNTGEGAVFTTHSGNQAFSEYPIPEPGKNARYDVGEYNYGDGYLKSDFISKNRLIGFGVTTIKGNAPLMYEARYVRRYRVALTNANLRAMGAKANSDTATTNLTYIDDAGANQTAQVGDFANLYTIAPGNSGNLTPDTWRELGGKQMAITDDGAHFVFQLRYVTGTTPIDEVGTLSYPNVYVYAYMQGAAATTTGVKTRSNPNANFIDPQDMYLGNTAFGGATGVSINEAQAKDTTNAVYTALTDTTLPAYETATKGTAFFLIKVYDTVETGLSVRERLFDAVVVGMKVYVGDRRRPFARLYDLNPYMESAVTGSNVGTDNQQATRAEAAAPTAVGKNIKRGGLYNLGTERAPIKSGYIEPRFGTGTGNASTALRPWVNYPSDPLDPYVMRSTTLATTSRQEYTDNRVTTDTIATTGTATRDKVSGKIILRGLAWDDQLIDQISVTIGGQAKVILKLNASSRKMEAPSGVEAWAFERLHWQTGHTVEWAYLWDTEAVPTGRTGGGPAPATAISVQVQDFNSGTDDASRLDSAAVTADAPAANPTAFKNSISVDIVPYITGLKRDDKFATTRSRQGWYSFYRGETNVRIVGYNLGSTTGTGGTVVYLQSSGGAANVDGTAITGGRSYTAPTNANMPNDGHSFTIPTDAASGKITVTVGTVVANNNDSRAWNHLSTHTNKSWNRENSDDTPGSDLWINKPYAHIWRSTQDLTAPATIFGNNTADGGSINADSPSMGLEYNTGTATTNQGRLHGTWGIRSNFGVYYGTNGNAARTTLQTANDPLLLTDFDYFPSNTNLNRNRTMVSVYEWDGRPQVFINTTMTNAGNETGEISATNGALTAAASATNTDSTDRWTNPRVRMTAAHTSDTRGNTGRLYSSMYDTMTKSLYFVYRSGTNNTGGYIDGESSTGTAATGSLAASARAGMWSAVDYIDAGGTNPTRPVIAYYDEANDTLRLAYCSLYNSATIGNWTRRNVLDASSPLLRGSGKYVSMKIVGDNIHLAFYNSTYNTMVYAVGTTTGTFTAVTVDNVVKGGVWTDIAVDSSGNPWITYGDLGRIGGNYDGVRVAYKTTATPANGGFTQANRALTDKVTNTSITGWEAVTMPANYIISDDRLNIEAWPPANRPGVTGTVSGTGGGWAAAVGYLGTDTDSVRQFRIGYFFKPDNAVVNAFQTVGN